MFQQCPNITQDCQKIDCSFHLNFKLTCPFVISLLNGGVPKAIHIKLFKNDTHQLTAAWRSTKVCDDSPRLSIHLRSIIRHSKESLQSFKFSHMTRLEKSVACFSPDAKRKQPGGKFDPPSPHNLKVRENGRRKGVEGANTHF